MVTGPEEAARPRELGPVEHRLVWIAWGLALQAIGLGIPVTAGVLRANREGLAGSLTHYTVRLIWHEMLRTRADVALVAFGVVVFVSGAVVMARPFTRRRRMLFIAVPLAATAGVAALGVLALVCAIVIAASESPGDANWGELLDSFSSSLPRRRRRR